MASEYEKKLINMQYQMKENQAYMTDYFKELETWTDEVKKKEENLKKSGTTQEKQDLPPIRHLAPVEKKRRKKKRPDDKNTVAKPAEKIKAYDYRKWDKFNVDAACEEVDKTVSSDVEYTTDEEWESEQLKMRADWEKERGNLFLQNNQLDEAINCYTRAIDLNPNNAIYLANRALCLIKQEKYGAAEMDCTLALSIDNAYMKAYLRRGTARMNLKKFDLALEDFKHVLKTEPTNKQAKEEIVNIERILESKALVFPIEKPIEKRSTKPLKQIVIEEINDDKTERVQERLNQINRKVKLNKNDEKLFDIANNRDEKPVSESNSANQINSVPLENDTTTCNIPTLTEKMETLIVKPTKSVTIPNAPTNGYQFRKDWQLMFNNIDDLTKYFQQISPYLYPKLFMNGLESDMLAKILRIFQNFTKAEKKIDLYAYMKNLSDVKRFKTQFMFLSNDDIQSENTIR